MQTQPSATPFHSLHSRPSPAHDATQFPFSFLSPQLVRLNSGSLPAAYYGTPVEGFLLFGVPLFHPFRWFRFSWCEAVLLYLWNFYRERCSWCRKGCGAICSPRWCCISVLLWVIVRKWNSLLSCERLQESKVCIYWKNWDSWTTREFIRQAFSEKLDHEDLLGSLKFMDSNFTTAGFKYGLLRTATRRFQRVPQFVLLRSPETYADLKSVIEGFLNGRADFTDSSFVQAPRGTRPLYGSSGYRLYSQYERLYYYEKSYSPKCSDQTMEQILQDISTQLADLSLNLRRHK